MNLLVCGTIYPRIHLLKLFTFQISLGVTVAYVSSLANLIVAARKRPSFHVKNGHEEMDVMSMGYFDSVVFLAMFLLIGQLRHHEAFSPDYSV